MTTTVHHAGDAPPPVPELVSSTYEPRVTRVLMPVARAAFFSRTWSDWNVTVPRLPTLASGTLTPISTLAVMSVNSLMLQYTADRMPGSGMVTRSLDAVAKEATSTE